MGNLGIARWLVSFFAALNFLICPVWAASEHQYDVAPAVMADALVEFAKQSDISIVRPHLSPQDGMANAVKGRFTLNSGLTRLLEGTGFSFEILSPTAVKIVRMQKLPAVPDDMMTRDPILPPVMEEIKVTTTRRSDFVDKLPYSMSVLSGAMLENLRGGSTNDAALKLVGVSATNQGNSRNKIIIRGISDGSFSGRAQALVTTYLDNSRMIYNAPEPSFKLIDISSIEVLRGPQGTLYGSGSLGGIYRVVTNKPVLDQIESDVTTSYRLTDGGGASQDYTAMLNLPVVTDRMAIRGAAYLENTGGYIDDVRLHLDNVNKSELYGGRLSTSLNLSDWLTVTTGVNYQHQITDDTNYYNGALGPLKRDNYLQEPRYDLLKHVYMTFEGALSWANFVTNISWLNRDLDNDYDATLAVPKLSALPLTPSRFKDDRHIKTISSETHFSSVDEYPFEWLTGLFLSHRTENLVNNIVTPGSSLVQGYGPTDILYTENLTEKLDEVALFGETTYYVTEKLALTGGLRWFHYNNSAVSLLDDVGLGNLSAATGKQKKNGLIPKFTVSYYANDAQLYYLQIAEGYRLGGINLKGPTADNSDDDAEEQADLLDGDRTALTTFTSDKSLNVELGYKHKMLDGRLHLNTAVFFTDWNNIQSDQFDTTGLPVIGNIGNGRVIGGEVEMAYQPLRAVQLHANAAWNFSELTKINPVFGAAVGAVKGGSLPGAPTFTANLSGQYDFSLGSQMRGLIDLSYTYVGAAHLLYKAGATRQSDAYHLGSARFQVIKGMWRVAVFADNIFDSNANSFAFGNPFSLNDMDQVTPLRPRSYGLRLGWSY